MVKSYEYESEVLQQLGYGSNPQTAVDRNRGPQEHEHRYARPTSRNSAQRAPKVFSDEQRHLRGRARLRRFYKIHPDLLFVAKATLCFSIVCAILIICVTAHMRVTANDRQIQHLTASIALAQAQHESLTNALAIHSNQVAIATQAHHLNMVQNPTEMTVALTYGQGEPSFGPQIADAH